MGTRSGQCGPKVPGRLAFPGVPNPRIYSISRFGKMFPAIFPGLSRSFPGEPPNRPRKQPQPSRVFWLKSHPRLLKKRPTSCSPYYHWGQNYYIPFFMFGGIIFQGRILAVWILAPKLPNSDLKIAVDFWVDFFLCFFQGKRPEKIHKKIHGKIHPGICSEKFPSDFCRSLFLIIFGNYYRKLYSIIFLGELITVM